LKYSGLHSQRPGAWTPAFTSVPAGGENPHPHLERLGLADGVVDDVDRPGVRHRQPLQRLVQPAAAPGDELFDDGQPWFVRQHFGGPELSGQLCLGVEAGHHGHGDVGMQRPQNRHRAQSQRPGAVDQDPARVGRRVTGDRVQGDRERIGEHGHLVGNRVGNAEEHAVVRGHQFGVSTGHVGRYPGVDAWLDVAVGETPAQAVVAAFTGRTGRLDAPLARKTATG